MIAAMTAADTGAEPRTASRAANLLTLAQRELRGTLRSRWFALYSIAFTALGLGVSWISGSAGGGSGLSGFSRTSAGLVNLILLVVPLMGLTAGAGSVAGERERGMLGYLMAQPVSRLEVLLGKFIGLGAALATCAAAGLGLCALVLAWRGAGVEPGSLLRLTALTVVLALCMLSVGLLISVMARTAAVATGTAIFAWLMLALVSDLALMSGVLALRMPIATLFGLSLINPLQVFKMWSLHSSAASLDVLGPAGLYADDTFGGSIGWVFAAAMAVWIVVPLGAAGLVFSRRSIT